MSEPTFDPRADWHTMETLAQRLLWDCLPHTFVVAHPEALGLPPASPEGRQVEHVASHVRTDAVKELLPLVATLSGLSYTALERAILVGRGSVELPREVQVLINAACVGVIANLVDLGALAVPTDDSENTLS